MPPKRRAINTDSDVDKESLKTAVSKEKVIWCGTDENHDNVYMVGKAWDRVAAALGCTKNSVMKMWKELCDEAKDLSSRQPDLTSGSAGGHSSRLSIQLHYADPVGFLKDKSTPVFETSGNLDALLEEPILIATEEKPNSTSSRPTFSKVGSATEEVTDSQFLASLVPKISHLSDKEKLSLRIELYEELQRFSAKLDFSYNDDDDDDDEITVLGYWRPDV